MRTSTISCYPAKWQEIILKYCNDAAGKYKHRVNSSHLRCWGYLIPPETCGNIVCPKTSVQFRINKTKYYHRCLHELLYTVSTELSEWMFGTMFTLCICFGFIFDDHVY